MEAEVCATLLRHKLSPQMNSIRSKIEVIMKNIVLLVSLIAILAAGPLRAQIPNDKATVVRLDPALDSLVSADAKLDLVKNDFGFTEGVVWVDEGKSGYLLLSDMYANVIYKVTP